MKATFIKNFKNFKNVKNVINKSECGDEIAPTISKVDAVSTIALQYVFDNDGNITEYGKRTLQSVLRLSKEDTAKGYESVGVTKDVETKINEASEIMTTHVDIADEETSMRVIRQIRSSIIQNKSQFEAFLKDFKPQGRKCGENATDNNNSVAKIDQMVNKIRKLSKLNKAHLESNIDEFLRFLIYDLVDRTDEEFKINYIEKEGSTQNEFVKFINTGVLPEGKNMLIDEYGETKLLLIKVIEDVTNGIIRDTIEDAKEDMFPIEDTVRSIYKNFINDVSKRCGISIDFVYSKMQTILGKTSLALESFLGLDSMENSFTLDVMTTVKTEVKTMVEKLEASATKKGVLNSNVQIMIESKVVMAVMYEALTTWFYTRGGANAANKYIKGEKQYTNYGKILNVNPMYLSTKGRKDSISAAQSDLKLYNLFKFVGDKIALVLEDEDHKATWSKDYENLVLDNDGNVIDIKLPDKKLMFAVLDFVRDQKGNIVEINNSFLRDNYMWKKEHKKDLAGNLVLDNDGNPIMVDVKGEYDKDVSDFLSGIIDKNKELKESKKGIDITGLMGKEINTPGVLTKNALDAELCPKAEVFNVFCENSLLGSTGTYPVNGKVAHAIGTTLIVESK